MPDMTPTASSQTLEDPASAQPVDCGYLHNAFGPGCPYCRQAVGAARLRDQPDSSAPHWVTSELEQAETTSPPGPDFRAVA